MRLFGLLFVMTVAVLGASPALAFECVPGRFVGKSWAVNAAYHDKDANLAVAKKGPVCELTFTSAAMGASEVWDIRDNKLTQRELDAAGKTKLAYEATLEVRGGIEGYYVSCKEGKCDASGDPRNFWRLENKGTKIVYSFWGIDAAKAGDPKTAARKRVEYTFTPSP